MHYLPLSYEKLNINNGLTNPSMVKSVNNRTYEYWERSLFQRACSVLTLDVPEDWNGSVKDFLYYCLFKYGYVVVFNHKDYGTIFQPCNLKGYDIYYQYTDAIVVNPAFKNDDKNLELKVGEECELIKLTPDYMGIFDVISYYAEKLSALDNAINMSIINSKFSLILGAKTKPAAEALKKMLDKINRGEPAVILDKGLLNDDPNTKLSPIQSWERNLKQTYITTDQLMDFQTLLNNFDAEIGIPTVPYQKKERMVTQEAEARSIDAMSRSRTWYETISNSLIKVNSMFPELNLRCKLSYDKEVDTNGQTDLDRDV